MIKLDYDQIFIKYHLVGSQQDHLCNSQCQGGDQHAPADLGAWAEGGEGGGRGGESGILEKVYISTGLRNHARYWRRSYWTGERAIITLVKRRDLQRTYTGNECGDKENGDATDYTPGFQVIKLSISQD